MTEIVPLNKSADKLLLEALGNICAEANEAARLATLVIKSDESALRFRRDLAKIMEIVDCRLLPSISKGDS